LNLESQLQKLRKSNSGMEDDFLQMSNEKMSTTHKSGKICGW
jgi:hypothetical protein